MMGMKPPMGDPDRMGDMMGAAMVPNKPRGGGQLAAMLAKRKAKSAPAKKPGGMQRPNPFPKR